MSLKDKHGKAASQGPTADEGVFCDADASLKPLVAEMLHAAADAGFRVVIFSSNPDAAVNRRYMKDGPGSALDRFGPVQPVESLDGKPAMFVIAGERVQHWIKGQFSYTPDDVDGLKELLGGFKNAKAVADYVSGRFPSSRGREFDPNS